MKKLMALTTLALLAVGAPFSGASAQSPEPAPPAESVQSAEGEVLAVVAQMFEGMRAKDAALLRSLFHSDALMTGTGMRNGSYQVTMNPPDGWIESIASFTGGEIDERIYEPQVLVSGPLASVWAEYDLYVGGEFRHCGVDAFHLALSDEGWKIVHVADTRVPEGCPAR